MLNKIKDYFKTTTKKCRYELQIENRNKKIVELQAEVDRLNNLLNKSYLLGIIEKKDKQIALQKQKITNLQNDNLKLMRGVK